ncbi:MAG: hypothetical protein KAQ81_09755 [Deltaproteobacteria bacterium]|nr:hypothetical protein [Deltaproteobacteria bacterium]
MCTPILEKRWQKIKWKLISSAGTVKGNKPAGESVAEILKGRTDYLRYKEAIGAIRLTVVSVCPEMRFFEVCAYLFKIR